MNRPKVVGLISFTDALDTCGRHQEAIVDTFHTTAVWRIQDQHRFSRLPHRVRFNVERRRSEITIIEQNRPPSWIGCLHPSPIHIARPPRDRRRDEQIPIQDSRQPGSRRSLFYSIKKISLVTLTVHEGGIPLARSNSSLSTGLICLSKFPWDRDFSLLFDGEAIVSMSFSSTFGERVDIVARRLRRGV